MYEQARKDMVARLLRAGYVRTPGVRKAMETIPRHIFVPEEMQRFAHADTPMDIGEGQTISAPHMVAMMLEILELRKGMKVLEVGCGSGYHASLAAYMVGSEGHVFTIDIIESLTVKARAHISQIGLQDRVTVIHGDGSKGLGEQAPFDRIMAACSAPKVPQPLIDQLADPGIAVIPVGTGFSQSLAIVRKEDGRVRITEERGVAFVLMRGEYGQ
jgi:protein-L-isoaspartate(D-aspartate) O-methyltransferase